MMNFHVQAAAFEKCKATYLGKVQNVVHSPKSANVADKNIIREF